VDIVEFYTDSAGDIRWRYKSAGNHEVMADGGQGYTSADDAIEGASRVTNRAIVFDEAEMAQALTAGFASPLVGVWV
jgi:uncharacterized protein YegP (UPF0339 family)